MARTWDEAIRGYITDMLALEEHIEKAVRAQIADFEKEYPDVTRELDGIHRHIESHVAALKSVAEKHGEPHQGVGDAIKRAGSIVAGLGAAAIDLVRNEKLPKDLRDDYTAISLASVGYLMLLTTARAFERTDVAKLAEGALADCAADIMTLNRVIPRVVVQFLDEDGLDPKHDVFETVHASVETAWR